MLKLDLEFEKETQSGVEFPGGIWLENPQDFSPICSEPRNCSGEIVVSTYKSSSQSACCLPFFPIYFWFFSQSGVDQWNLCCYSAFCTNSAKLVKLFCLSIMLMTLIISINEEADESFKASGYRNHNVNM